MEKNTEYNSDSVVRLVRRLRRKAVFIILLWPIIGVLVGVYLGNNNGGKLAIVIGGIMGAFVGYLIGSMRYLYYNTQAMSLLCLKRIEENTRGG